METRFIKLLSALLVAMLMLSPVAIMEEVAPVVAEEPAPAAEEPAPEAEEAAPEAEEPAPAAEAEPDQPEADDPEAAAEEDPAPADDTEPVSAEEEEPLEEIIPEAVDTVIAEAEFTELEDVDVEGLSIEGVEEEASDPALYTPEGVSIEATFPDPPFRAYVASNFDGDGDGFLSEEEIDSVGEINLNMRGDNGEELHDADGRYLNLGIHSLKGIEVFTSLGCLTCYDNPLTESPDLSKNVGLDVLELGGCGLTTLDVSSNTNLRILHVEDNPIKELDISKCATLASIVTDDNMRMDHNGVVGAIVTYAVGMDDEDYENDLELWASPTTRIIAGEGRGREPRVINISETFQDEGLRGYLSETFDDGDGVLTEDEIAKVEEGGYPEGFHLHERTVNSLSGLEVFVGLHWLDIWRIDGLEVLDLTKMPWLDGVSANECNLKQVIIPANARLENLQLERNLLTELDISNCPQEFRNKITKENYVLKDNDGVAVYQVPFKDEETGEQGMDEILVCDADVVITGADAVEPLESLPLDEAHFTDDGLRQHLKDRYDLDKNDRLSPRERAEVEDIDLHQFSGNEKEPYVIDPDTHAPAGLGVKSLKGIENFPWLRSLSVFCNPIGAIDVDLGIFHDLEYLECWNCGLKEVDVTHNPKLHILDCGDNALTTLNISNNSELEYLWTADNNLTELDVTHNPKLREMDCSNNKLKKLDISKNPKLQGLWLINNGVTALDISACPILVEKTDRAKTSPVYFGDNNKYVRYPFTITDTWEEEDGIHTDEYYCALACDATVTITGLIDSTPKPAPAPAAAAP
ncbi:MAG: hypothetical protein IKE76_00655, partial [Clostridia bacterium]|nr:hypothetical protein [Clostridia bacterium]